MFEEEIKDHIGNGFKITGIDLRRNEKTLYFEKENTLEEDLLCPK